jgi:hypothetical protein
MTNYVHYPYYIKLYGHHIKFISGTHPRGHMYQNIAVPNDEVMELIETFNQHSHVLLHPYSPFLLFRTLEDMALFKLSLPSHGPTLEELSKTNSSRILTESFKNHHVRCRKLQVEFLKNE